jgi:hypothetical protein
MHRAHAVLALLAANLAVGACAHVPPPKPAEPRLPPSDACRAAKVEAWYGKAATAAVRAQIAKATGAARLRWLYPDSVVTMDYRPDRLNVTTDRKGDVIRSARCG